MGTNDDYELLKKIFGDLVIQNKKKLDNIEEEKENILSEVDEHTPIQKNDFNDPNYINNFGTQQQTKRDEIITELLNKYVENYKDKVDKNIIYKNKLFDLCMTIIFIYTIIVPFLASILFLNKSNYTINDIISIITVCISMITLVIGLLQIITKYVFPKQEEKYITDIVTAIQHNDLQHKKINMNYIIGNNNIEENDKNDNINK